MFLLFYFPPLEGKMNKVNREKENKKKEREESFFS